MSADPKNLLLQVDNKVHEAKQDILDRVDRKAETGESRLIEFIRQENKHIATQIDNLEKRTDQRFQTLDRHILALDNRISILDARIFRLFFVGLVGVVGLILKEPILNITQQFLS